MAWTCLTAKNRWASDGLQVEMLWCQRIRSIKIFLFRDFHAFHCPSCSKLGMQDGMSSYVSRCLVNINSAQRRGQSALRIAFDSPTFSPLDMAVRPEAVEESQGHSGLTDIIHHDSAFVLFGNRYNQSNRSIYIDLQKHVHRQKLIVENE